MRQASHELIILFNKTIDIEEASEISIEFDEFLRGLLKQKDYIFTSLNFR
jgi:hypothetical protein